MTLANRTTDDRLDDLLDAAQKQISLTQKQMAWLVKRSDDEQEQTDLRLRRLENMIWRATFEMRLAATLYLLSIVAAVLFGLYAIWNLISHG